MSSYLVIGIVSSGATLYVYVEIQRKIEQRKRQRRKFQAAVKRRYNYNNR